jgi:hypothetical protein
MGIKIGDNNKIHKSKIINTEVQTDKEKGIVLKYIVCPVIAGLIVAAIVWYFK